MGNSHHHWCGTAPLLRSPRLHLARIGRVATYVAIVCRQIAMYSFHCLHPALLQNILRPRIDPYITWLWLVLPCHPICRSNVKVVGGSMSIRGVLYFNPSLISSLFALLTTFHLSINKILLPLDNIMPPPTPCPSFLRLLLGYCCMMFCCFLLWPLPCPFLLLACCLF
jgi:hypothetical protein